MATARLLRAAATAAAALLLPASAAAPYFAAAGDASVVRLVGRWAAAANASAVGDWAGVSAQVRVALNATGAPPFTTLVAVLEDGCGGGNKLAVTLAAPGMTGGRPLRVATLYTAPAASRYVLFSSPARLNVAGAEATFTLTKAVEARFTQCAGVPDAGGAAPLALRLLGFESDAPFLPAPPAPARRLLVLGDSISSGDLLECCPTALGCAGALPLANALWADDVTLTYGSLVAAALGADAQTISWGGIGAAAGDVPGWLWPTLPDALPWTLAWPGQLAGGPGRAPLLPYNLSAFVPAGVIANLGTNDSAGGRFKNATFTALYVERYAAMLALVADAAAAAGAPRPQLFVGVGPMTAAYAAAAADVAQRLNAAGYAATLLNLTLSAGRCGCGHPSAQDHAELAAAVLPVVKAALKW